MSRELAVITIVALLVSASVAKCGAAEADVVWRDATDFDIEGRGWRDTESPYDRLPARAKATVPEGVWGLGKHSAGLCVRFLTTAKSISVRWDLASESLAMPHMPATGVSGVDLYRRAEDGSWRFVANGRPTQHSGNTMTASLPAGAAAGTECLLYLPLYNGVHKVEIGAPAGATISRAPARPDARSRSVVYYGTSIAQGGCASRPGLAHVAILGRMLDRPMINLGFSGSGRMEPAVSDLLAELDPPLYVIDCLWNMGGMPEPEFTSRLTTLIETIRKAHPATPILFVGQSHIYPGRAPSDIEQLQDRIVKRLSAAGTPGLHLFPGKPLLGTDGEGTVDGVHPNDLGMRRQADALAPALTRLLRQ